VAAWDAIVAHVPTTAARVAILHFGEIVGLDLDGIGDVAHATLSKSGQLDRALTGTFDVVVLFVRSRAVAASTDVAAALAGPTGALVVVESDAPARGTLFRRCRQWALRRAIRRELDARGFRSHTVLLVPSLARARAWIGEGAPPGVIQLTLAHAGFIRGRMGLRLLSLAGSRALGLVLNAPALHVTDGRRHAVS
jgi:hypothetical protein